MYSCGHVSCNIRSSYSSMSKALYGPTAVLPVMMIGVMMMMMMSLGVSAQPTVNDDDEAYCQSGTFEEFVNEIRADIKTSCQPRTSDETARDVQQMKEQLAELKDLLGSHRQEENETARAIKEDVQQMKEQLAKLEKLLGSHQQEENETARVIKEDLTEVKNLLGSRQQPCKFGAFDSSSLCECKIHSLLICRQSE